MMLSGLGRHGWGQWWFIVIVAWTQEVPQNTFMKYLKLTNLSSIFFRFVLFRRQSFLTAVGAARTAVSDSLDDGSAGSKVKKL